MNKFFKLFCGAAVLTSLVACSSEEPTPDPTPSGDVAYMKISISAATETRATEDGPLTPSDDVEAEHAVKNLDFYFFDNAGNYVDLKATVTNPGVTDVDADRPNVEFISDAGYIVLEGLHQNTYPTYMLTVINAPGFKCPSTLALASKELQEFAAETDNGFVMSTSSYFKKDAQSTTTDENHNDTYYYATMLKDTDFKTTIDEAQNNQPVQVYVERLAAKAQLKMADDINKKTDVKDENGNDITVYPITQSVAGSANSGEEQLHIDLYIRVLGWGLNATNPDSYLSKQLLPAWASANPVDGWTTWNNATQHRSFWAESNVYTLGNAALQNKLTYKTLAQLNKAVGTGIDYCYENSHEAGNAIFDSEKGVDSRVVSHVVLDTEVGTIENGVFKPITLVTYRGLLYKDATYQDLILSNMKNAGNLNFYVKVGNEYKQVDRNYVTYVTDNTDGTKLGQVKLIPNTNTITSENPLYIKNGNEYTTTGAFAAFETALANAQTQKAVRHTSGRSVYYIPVEHRALPNMDASTLAYYGMVRNHWYVLTVNKFSKVGHGVFDPETETIKPDGPEDPLYYVGANINILSWKLVNQSVDL